ncbi:unnamed protein product [Lymnaea stagnalis]|uniref:Uncharacterized protein n=1 Tax=Lymnaea stagnalis TaxID=6523 RepID=A0AAV2HVW3_LYMST
MGSSPPCTSLHVTRTRGLTAFLLSAHAWTLVGFLCLVDISYGLKCWHCIAENCHLDPQDHSTAESRVCYQGQTCQKVVFEMMSETEKVTYKSTVRSCADECIPQNDFNNCTIEQYTSRGCVRRVCCDDSDMCNSAPGLHAPDTYIRLIPYSVLLSCFVFKLGPCAPHYS